MSAEPPNVASLDYCADQYVMGLADPEQIRAVSTGADNDYSHLHARAAGLPQARATAEDILARRADVAVRSWGGGPRLQGMLARHGVEVVQLSWGQNFDDVRSDVTQVAAALGQEERGRGLIAEMDARLAALKVAAPADPPMAVYVTPGGVTAGAGTFVNELFAAAGVRNAAAVSGGVGWAPLPLEQLVLEPPEAVVLGFFDVRTDRMDAWSASRHPAMRETLAGARSVRLTSSLIACPGWFSVEAAERIAALYAEEGA